VGSVRNFGRPNVEAFCFFQTRNKTLFPKGVLGRPVRGVCSDGSNIEVFFLQGTQL